MRRLAGYIFVRDGDERLSFRLAWRWYIAGCALSALISIAGVTALSSFVQDHDNAQHPGPSSSGTSTARARLARQESARHRSLVMMGISPMIFVPIAYVLVGAWELRNPFVIDRVKDQVLRGKTEVCKASLIRAIRLVEPFGSQPGTYRRTTRGRTEIFAQLDQAPWTIKLDFFPKPKSGRRFAVEMSEFLHVPLDDRPKPPPSESRHGFTVIPLPVGSVSDSKDDRSRT